MKSSVLTRYRVMAYVTAVLLIVLVFVGMPMKYFLTGGSSAQVFGDSTTQYVGMLHGFLYMVYLLAALDLTLRLRIPKLHMLLVLIAGTIPFGAFYAERKMTGVYQSRLAAAQTRSARDEVNSN